MSNIPLTFEQYRMLRNPSWTFSPFWSHSAFPYPSSTVTYGSENTPPENKLDIFHPYYRTKVSKYVVPAIAFTGVGFVAHTTWNTYFRHTKLDSSLDDEKKSVKTLWKNIQGGFIGGMAFGLFITLLVSIQLWTKGLSLPKTLKYFGDKAQDAGGLTALTQTIA